VIIATHEEGLRRLVLHDEGCIQSMLGIHLRDNEAPGLEPRTQALVRLGGLVAMGAAPLSYHWAAEAALDASATSEVAMAIGYDLDQAFEALSDD